MLERFEGTHDIEFPIAVGQPAQQVPPTQPTAGAGSGMLDGVGAQITPFGLHPELSEDLDAAAIGFQKRISVELGDT
jgi:hypothetical protein